MNSKDMKIFQYINFKSHGHVQNIAQEEKTEDIQAFFHLQVVQNLDEKEEENDGIWNDQCFYRFYEDGAKIVIRNPDEYNYFYKVVGNQAERLYQSPDREYEAFLINFDQLGF